MKNHFRLLVLVLAAAALLAGCAKTEPQETLVQTSAPMTTAAPEPQEATPAPAPAEADAEPAAEPSGEPSGEIVPREDVEEVEPEGPADEGIEGLNAPPEAAPIDELPEDPGAENAGTEGVFTSEAQDLSVTYDSSCRPALGEDGSIILYLTDADDVPYIQACLVSGWTAGEYLSGELSTLKAAQEVIMDSGDTELANVGGMDVQSTWANYTVDGSMVTMIAYARDTDGGVLACTAYFDEATAVRALELLETTFVTAQTPAA